MTFPLASDGTACADQSGGDPSLNMANDQESPSGRVADRDQATLVVGMVGISKGGSQGIIEYGDSFVERHAVLLDVRCSFLAIPLEAHRTILTRAVGSVRLLRKCRIDPDWRSCRGFKGDAV